MHRFANPNQFLRIANPLLPWLAWLAALCIGAGLYLGPGEGASLQGTGALKAFHLIGQPK